MIYGIIINHKQMKRQKDSAYQKRQAFKSFLETSSDPKPDTKPKNNSDHEEVYEEEYAQQSTECNICGNDVPDALTKKKLCGFCELVACKEHLRKRRRRKNKWEKICDNCEDKYLYEACMKLEIKAEEALGVKEEIVTMKYEQTKDVLENKQAKRRELSFKTQQLQTKHDEAMLQISKDEGKLLSISNKLQSDEIACGQLTEYIQRMQAKIKENHSEDYRILVEENDRISKDLSRIQKKCHEVVSAIERREKELEESYEAWQRQMYRKSMETPANNSRVQEKDKCSIF